MKNPFLLVRLMLPRIVDTLLDDESVLLSRLWWTPSVRIAGPG